MAENIKHPILSQIRKHRLGTLVIRLRKCRSVSKAQVLNHPHEQIHIIMLLLKHSAQDEDSEKGVQDRERLIV